MSEKKVGIISFQNANNYGALLQLFALQTAVEKLGEKAEIINYESQNFDLEEFQLDCFKDFKHKYLKLSPKYVKGGDIDTSNYDVIVTGSDQVFNPALTKNDSTYFLDFIKKDEGIVKASYAASTSIDGEKEKTVREFFAKYLKEFSFVSLREKEFIPIAQEYTKEKVISCVDPTQLLSANDYESIINIPEITDRGYILLFRIWPYEKLRDFANILSLHTKKKLVAVTFYEGEYTFVEGSKIVKQLEVPKWLSYFKNADLVITDSFHGLMFSIIFRRPFYIWAKKDARAYRIKNILKSLELSDRMYRDDIVPSKIDFSIDYTKANEKLSIMKESSIEYLKQIINSK